LIWSATSPLASMGRLPCTVLLTFKPSLKHPATLVHILPLRRRHDRRGPAIPVHPALSRSILELRVVICIVSIQGIEPRGYACDKFVLELWKFSGGIRPLWSSFSFAEHVRVYAVSPSSFSSISPSVFLARFNSHCWLPSFLYVRCHGRALALAAVLLVLCAKTGLRFPDRSHVLPRPVFLPRHARSCVSSRRPLLCGVVTSQLLGPNGGRIRVCALHSCI
jgi:hypothetical protein